MSSRCRSIISRLLVISYFFNFIIIVFITTIQPLPFKPSSYFNKLNLYCFTPFGFHRDSLGIIMFLMNLLAISVSVTDFINLNAINSYSWVFIE